MPLKCLADGREIFAWHFTDDPQWEAIREENQRLRHLRMTCCGSGVTLRTSKLGTRHFAHTRKGECTTGPESAEHLLAKAIIAKSAEGAGWEVATEFSGASKTGETWTADVFAKKEGMRGVAFEVQWSRQHEIDTRARQERYVRSNVRGLWLLRQHDVPVDREVPAFRIFFSEQFQLFSVALPSFRYDQSVNRRESADVGYWQQLIPLPVFIAGALQGRLKFAPAADALVRGTIWTTTKFCYKCGCETKIVNFIRLDLSGVFPGHADVDVSIYDLDEFKGGREMLSKLLPREFLSSHNIGEVKPRFGGRNQKPMVSNGCAHCDCLHGQMHDMDEIETLEAGPELPMMIPVSGVQQIEGVAEVIERWWFDQGNNETFKGDRNRRA